MNKDGVVYIPYRDEEPQLRVYVTAHCGFEGHRGIYSTTAIIKEKIHWDTLESDVKD